MASPVTCTRCGGSRSSGMAQDFAASTADRCSSRRPPTAMLNRHTDSARHDVPPLQARGAEHGPVAGLGGVRRRSCTPSRSRARSRPGLTDRTARIPTELLLANRRSQPSSGWWTAALHLWRTIPTGVDGSNREDPNRAPAGQPTVATVIGVVDRRSTPVAGLGAILSSKPGGRHPPPDGRRLISTCLRRFLRPEPWSTSRSPTSSLCRSSGPCSWSRLPAHAPLLAAPVSPAPRRQDQPGLPLLPGGGCTALPDRAGRLARHEQPLPRRRTRPARTPARLRLPLPPDACQVPQCPLGPMGKLLVSRASHLHAPGAPF